MDFDALPLVAKGESKIVRYNGQGEVAIQLIPSVYSYTHNRGGMIPGSDVLRMQASMIFAQELQWAGIPHAYRRVDLENRLVYSDLALESTRDGLTFDPLDLSKEERSHLQWFTPLEVVVKKAHFGTPKHRYYEMDRYPTFQGDFVVPEGPYPDTIVRFDWRNPLVDRNGNRLANECLPEDMAAWWIDVQKARKTALGAFNALQKFLNPRGIELIDICFFISQDGSTILSEVSPDCGRYRSLDGESLDKDVWRRGGSHTEVLEKWQRIIDMIS